MQRLLLNNKVLIIGVLSSILLTAINNQANTQPVDEQYLAGCSNYMKGDFSKAVENFSLAIIRNNADEQLYIKRGASFLQLNEIERSLSDFSEANLINPQVADLWLARAYSLSDNVEMAIAYLKSHLKSPFRLPEDSIKKDPAFDKLQETQEWYSLWQTDWYNKAEKAGAEATYYSRKGDLERAISLLDNAILDEPGNVSLLIQRGNLLSRQGNYGAAIADYSNVLREDKNLGIGYEKRGIAYLRAGKYKDAVNDFDKAIRNDPGKFALYLQRAEALAGQQKWSQAIDDLLLYLSYFEQDWKVLYQCGEYYYESGDYINALKCFNQNLREDPNNPLYYKARGKTYLKTATYRYAINDLSMSLDLDPNDAEVWMYLGLSKIQSGDQENGCSDLEKSGKMGNAGALKYILEYCR